MNRSLVARALEPVGKFGNHDIGLARGGRSVVLSDKDSLIGRDHENPSFTFTTDNFLRSCLNTHKLKPVKGDAVGSDTVGLLKICLGDGVLFLLGEVIASACGPNTTLFTQDGGFLDFSGGHEMVVNVRLPGHVIAR